MPDVREREVGVKLGHKRSGRGSLSQSEKAEVPTGLILLLCWCIQDVTVVSKCFPATYTAHGSFVDEARICHMQNTAAWFVNFCISCTAWCHTGVLLHLQKLLDMLFGLTRRWVNCNVTALSAPININITLWDLSICMQKLHRQKTS